MTVSNKSRRVAKRIAGSMIIAALTSSISAQTYTFTPSYAPAPPVVAGSNIAPPAYAADQLDQMLGPIALYPDPLLSEVLAASTYPQDVAAAGQWVQYHPNPSELDINSQPWDPSVKAIARFPDVVQMMAGNMDWTEALAAAFVNQQQEVMDSVQRLRARALAAHTLISTPQQEVVQDNGVIEIFPAQPDVIYAPQYDAGIVYTTPALAGPFITFGPPCPFGVFFDLGLDYHQHRFLRGVRFDRDRRQFDFDRTQVWQHDPHRSIPAPSHAFVAPHGLDVHRGGTEPARAPGAFNSAARPRAAVQSPRPPERPVTGLPPAPQRSAPPRAPAVQAQPRPVPVPARPVAPPPAPPRNERPVTGLPSRPAPTPRPAPAPVQRSAPAPRSPAFNPGGDGGASARGNNSMHRK